MLALIIIVGYPTALQPTAHQMEIFKAFFNVE